MEDVVRHEGEAADPGLPGRARALRAPPPPQRHVLRGRGQSLAMVSRYLYLSIIQTPWLAYLYCSRRHGAVG